MLNIVILAAGKGTRMRSALPKVMHPLSGRPLLEHVLERARELQPDQVQVVVGYQAAFIEAHFSNQNLNFVEQKTQQGTGDAVRQALPGIDPQSIVLILYGDVPLITADTLRKLVSITDDNTLGLLTVDLPTPQGYGRIVRDDNQSITAIVEQKDATTAQLAIHEVNTGVMAVSGRLLHQWLPRLSNDNAQGEYYLTDIIAMAHADGVGIDSIKASSELEVMGINNRQQQAQLERQLQLQTASQLMDDGVTLLDPNRFDCRGTLKAGRDCRIDINCVFEGEVTLGDNVSIGPGCSIKNTIIGDNTVVSANTVIEDSVIERYCQVGPFARIRPGSQLADGVKVGNFVETKKALLGVGSKINHLSYIGDATVGADVNIGAGTITCNYDGANKHQTLIGSGVFIGSNSALVAPLTIGENATVAAGSTVTGNVDASQLVVARQRQRNIDGWKKPKKTKSD